MQRDERVLILVTYCLLFLGCGKGDGSATPNVRGDTAKSDTTAPATDATHATSAASGEEKSGDTTKSDATASATNAIWGGKGGFSSKVLVLGHPILDAASNLNAVRLKTACEPMRRFLEESVKTTGHARAYVRVVSVGSDYEVVVVPEVDYDDAATVSGLNAMAIYFGRSGVNVNVDEKGFPDIGHGGYLTLHNGKDFRDRVLRLNCNDRVMIDFDVLQMLLFEPRAGADEINYNYARKPKPYAVLVMVKNVKLCE